MKNYSFFLDSDKFDVDITSKVDGENFYELYFNGTRIYILVPIPDDTESVLQIIYPLSKYSVEIDRVKGILSKQFLILSIVALLISFIFSLYTLHPLRRAYSTLEEFIKDIIHDLNTPITSIAINLKDDEKELNERLRAISKSCKCNLHRYMIIHLYTPIS